MSYLMMVLEGELSEAIDGQAEVSVEKYSH